MQYEYRKEYWTKVAQAHGYKSKYTAALSFFLNQIKNEQNWHSTKAETKYKTDSVINYNTQQFDTTTLSKDNVNSHKSAKGETVLYTNIINNTQKSDVDNSRKPERDANPANMTQAEINDYYSYITAVNILTICSQTNVVKKRMRIKHI